MIVRSIRLMALGAAMGIAADRLNHELHKPPAEQFPWLRRQVNSTVNPWLLEHHIPGSERAEIGTLEHVGRRTGAVHLTPVHPTVSADTVLIPAPMGVGSQWAQNVLASGHARMQLHETLYDLDAPELIPVSATGFFPRPFAARIDRLGWRYMRLRVAAMAAGAFPTPHESLETRLEGEPLVDMSAEIPIEPRMIDREGAPA
jgi:hypothetical protein